MEFKIVWNKFRILSRFVSYPVALNLSCILEIRVDQPKQSLLTGPCRVSWGLLNAMYFEGYQICILRVTIVGYRTPSRATVPLLRYAPLTWQSGGECQLSLWIFCKLVRLMDTGRNQNLLCVPESESCPLKYGHISMQSVKHKRSYWRVKTTATPVLHMAAVRSRLLRPHARADVIVCAKHHQSGDRSLYCIASEFY